MGQCGTKIIHIFRIFPEFAHLDDFLREGDAPVAVLVLRLVDALIVLEGVALDTHRVQELVLCASAVDPLVAQHDGCPTAPEQSVLQQVAALVPVVQVRGDNLGGDDQRVRARLPLSQQLLREIDADERGAATHAGEIVRLDVLPETKLAHYHRAERRGRGEEAAVDDQYVNFRRLEVGLLKGALDNVRDDELRLLAGGFHGIVGRLAVEALRYSWRPGSRLACPGTTEDALHEVEGIGGEAILVPHHFHYLVVGNFPRRGGFERDKIDQVDRLVHSGQVDGDHESDYRTLHTSSEDYRRLNGIVEDFAEFGADRLKRGESEPVVEDLEHQEDEGCGGWEVGGDVSAWF